MRNSSKRHKEAATLPPSIGGHTMSKINQLALNIILLLSFSSGNLWSQGDRVMSFALKTTAFSEPRLSDDFPRCLDLLICMLAFLIIPSGGLPQYSLQLLFQDDLCGRTSLPSEP